MASLREMELRGQPVRLGKSWLDVWAERPVLAAEAWVKGPKKPRGVLREKEIPSEDMSYAALQKRGILKLYDEVKVQSIEDLKKIRGDVDLLVIEPTGTWTVGEEVLEGLISLNVPILSQWDSWGRSFHGRYSKLRLERFLGDESKYYVPFGVDDLKAIFGAINGWKFIRRGCLLYIGGLPSYSVNGTKRTFDFDYLKNRFGADFVHIDFEEYLNTVKNAEDSDAERVAERWRGKYNILDGRDKRLRFYAKIYLALKKLLNKHEANALTIDCGALPDVEYVPCFAFSLLIDEDVPAVCEGDIPTFYMMSAMMGSSGKPVFMGNLNENATHLDIEQDIITVNHDVIPPSMGCRGCKLSLRDFHAQGKGLTPYVGLEEGSPVTMGGIGRNLDKMWVTRGVVQWSEDTTHCRITAGVKVGNAKQVSKSAFGHHLVMVYGDYIEELKILAGFLGLKYVEYC